MASDTPSMPGAMPESLPQEAIAYAQQFFTAARTGAVDVLRAPLEAGLPSNLTNENGDTLLMLAAYHGHPEVVKLLLQHGADPDRLNDRSQSPLSGAIYKQEREVVRLLLGADANPDLGTPTAWQTTKMFGVTEWEREFARVRERIDAKKAKEAEGQAGEPKQ
ncbi:hypothetical protein JCM8097_008683 [Rhodosporidiobolus ruineniae]